MTFEEQKEVIKDAIDISNTPIEIFKNIMEISYSKCQADAYVSNVICVEFNEDESEVEDE